MRTCCYKQVNNDIRDLERKLSLLRKAIVEKDLPLKVAQTRLDERTRRMNLELTHDEPMQGSVSDSVHIHRDKLTVGASN